MTISSVSETQVQPQTAKQRGKSGKALCVLINDGHAMLSLALDATLCLAVYREHFRDRSKHNVRATRHACGQWISSTRPRMV
jgi:hypothetical protein